MSDGQLFDLVRSFAYAAALKFLNNCDDKEARGQPGALIPVPSGWSINALKLAARRGGVPEELIRAMVERGRSFDYINTAAMHASSKGQAANLDLLLTLGADPGGCRYYAQSYHRYSFRNSLGTSACLNVLDRFEQRTTLACCLRRYDDLHISSPLVLHTDIAALSLSLS
jgi:hypothetical protein